MYVAFLLYKAFDFIISSLEKQALKKKTWNSPTHINSTHPLPPVDCEDLCNVLLEEFLLSVMFVFSTVL